MTDLPVITIKLPSIRFLPVVIESPYEGEVALNRAYLQACIRDCISRGETPYASHQMLTMALDDDKDDERALGMSAGLDMRDALHAAGFQSVYYVDLGWSSGMQEAARGKEREERRLVGKEIWERICAEAVNLFAQSSCDIPKGYYEENLRGRLRNFL